MKICSLLFCLFFVVSSLNAQQDGNIPDAVNKWMKNELSKEKKNDCPSFFCNEDSRLIGYISNYDSRKGISKGVINTTDEITGEERHLNVTIQADGRFEIGIPMNYPKMECLDLGKYTIQFYIEPGRTLALLFNEDGSGIEFNGSLARLNDELRQFSTKAEDYWTWEPKLKTVLPVDFMRQQMKKQDEELRRLDQTVRDKDLSPKATAILKNDIYVTYAVLLFDFLIQRNNIAESFDTSNAFVKLPVPDIYYSFIKNIPTLNDPLFLVPIEIRTFINRLEFCAPFDKAGNTVHLTKTATEEVVKFNNMTDFFKEEKVEINDQEIALMHWVDSVNNYLIPCEDDFTTIYKDNLGQLIAFNTKYHSRIQDYVNKNRKYNQLTTTSEITYQLLEPWRKKDSVCYYQFMSYPSLVYDIVKVRSIHQYSSLLSFGLSRDEAIDYMEVFTGNFGERYLKQEAFRRFKKYFPENPTDKARETMNGKLYNGIKLNVSPGKKKSFTNTI